MIVFSAVSCSSGCIAQDLDDGLHALVPPTGRDPLRIDGPMDRHALAKALCGLEPGPYLIVLMDGAGPETLAVLRAVAEAEGVALRALWARNGLDGFQVQSVTEGGLGAEDLHQIITALQGRMPSHMDSAGRESDPAAASPVSPDPVPLPPSGGALHRIESSTWSGPGPGIGASDHKALLDQIARDNRALGERLAALQSLDASHARLQDDLRDARGRPLKILAELLLHLFLSRVTANPAWLPRKTADRLRNSAAKRAPDRCDHPIPLRQDRDAAPEAEMSAAASEDWAAALRRSGETQGVVRSPPLVSVIMATRNRADRIDAAIVSVLAQSWTNWELLIVDDDSTDRTCETLTARFCDPRIRVLPVQGRGVCDARNTGLAAANGSFFAYLDSDNRWFPDFLELMVLALELDGAASGYGIQKVYPEGLDRSGTAYFHQKPFDPEHLLIQNFIDLNVFVHRRALYARHGGFDPGLRRMVDWDLIIRYTRTGAPLRCPLRAVAYDAGPNADRISNTEPLAYLDVVRNRHLIDWPALRGAVTARQPDLVSIILCVSGSSDPADRCLHAVFAHTAGAAFEVILVDNGSAPETANLLAAWAARAPEIRLVATPVTFHRALARNFGFARSRGQRVVFLSTEAEVTPGWFGPLLAALDADGARAVRPTLLSATGQAPCTANLGPGGTPPEHRTRAQGKTGREPSDKACNCTAVAGACLGVNAQDFAAAQGFDPLSGDVHHVTDPGLQGGAAHEPVRSVPGAVVIHHRDPTRCPDRSNAPTP